MKPCQRCGVLDRNPSGACRPCTLARGRVYRQVRAHKNREANARPFGLTPRQAQAMDALTRLGSRADVAEAWGVERNTIGHLVKAAIKKIGAENEGLALLAWDRLNRSRQELRRVSSVFEWRAQ